MAATKITNFLLYEDITLTVPATLLAERITYLPEILYHYNRLNDSSLQNTKVESNKSKIIFKISARKQICFQNCIDYSTYFSYNR